MEAASTWASGSQQWEKPGYLSQQWAGWRGMGKHNIDTGLTLRYGGGSRMNIRILRRL